MMISLLFYAIFFKQSIDKVLNVFNNYNKSLKFTHEIENNHSISFLDVKIINKNNGLHTNWYIKPTSSTRILNYFSNHPIQLKRNIIYNLVDRAILLSDKQYHCKNINYVKRIEKFISLNIKKRLCSIKSKNSINNKKLTKKHFNTVISIPFINDNFVNKLKKTLIPFNIHIVPKINNQLNNIITLDKDKLSKLQVSGCVYEFSCKNCSKNYVGETKRCLSDRIKEHKNQYNKKSVTTKHIVDLNLNFNWETDKILDIEDNYFKRLISEMLHINSNDNTLNRKEDIQFLSEIYKNLCH